VARNGAKWFLTTISKPAIRICTLWPTQNVAYGVTYCSFCMLLACMLRVLITDCKYALQHYQSVNELNESVNAFVCLRRGKRHHCLCINFVRQTSIVMRLNTQIPNELSIVVMVHTLCNVKTSFADFCRKRIDWRNKLLQFILLYMRT